jgi:hypothetical protein
MPIVRKIKITNPHAAKYQLKGLSARAALVCLMQQYGLHKKTFVWQAGFYTVEGALKQIDDYLLDIECGKFGIIRFYGGPPGCAKWFDGTLLTMLSDAAMFESHSTPSSNLLDFRQK